MDDTISSSYFIRDIPMINQIQIIRLKVFGGKIIPFALEAIKGGSTNRTSDAMLKY